MDISLFGVWVWGSAVGVQGLERRVQGPNLVTTPPPVHQQQSVFAMGLITYELFIRF